MQDHIYSEGYFQLPEIEFQPFLRPAGCLSFSAATCKSWTKERRFCTPDFDGLAALFCSGDGLNPLSSRTAIALFSMFASSMDFLGEAVYFYDRSQNYTAITWNYSLTWRPGLTSTLFREALTYVEMLLAFMAAPSVGPPIPSASGRHFHKGIGERRP